MQMTFEQIVPLARTLPTLERLKLIRILVDELDPISEDIAPFEPFKTYYIHTPVESFGAGKILMDALQAETRG
jgi:hypothetical protein